MRCPKAALVANILQFFVCKAKHLLGFCNAEIQNISIDTHTVLFLKHTGQIELADEKLFRQRIQRNFFSVVLIQIISDRVKVLLFQYSI